MRRIWPILFALALAAGCQAGGGPGPGVSSKSSKRPAVVDGIPTAAGDHVLTIGMGGLVPRSYRLHVPPQLAATTRRLPLLLAMHGGFDSPAAMEDRTGFSPMADRKGFLVAYPEGTATAWNAAGECCGIAKMIHADDIGFLMKLIDKLDGTGLVDSRRVYATGFSNGAAMSYLLACHDSARVAAVGVVEGALAPGCKPDHKVSMIIFHGTKDANVPFYGGGRVDIDNPSPFPPVSDAVNFWRKADGVGGMRAASAPAGNTQCSTAGTSVAVTFCKINGGTHTWPSYASAQQWEFFAAHPKT
jgi:polyhydroxybutyrate depolymerase